MTTAHTAPADLRAFLLGSLPSAEREALESRLLDDDTLFDELCTLDDELIDDFIRGALSRDDARLLTRRLHATRRGRRRLALMRFLDAEATAAHAAKPLHLVFLDWLRAAPAGPALLAQAALLALVVGPLAWQNAQLSQRLDHAAATAAQLATSAPASAAAADNSLRPVEATFDLPAASRSSAPELRLPVGLERIRLRLPLPPETSPEAALTATLDRVSGTASRHRAAVLSDELGLWAEVTLDVTGLGDGLHSLVVDHSDGAGATLVGQYTFLITTDGPTSAPGR